MKLSENNTLILLMKKKKKVKYQEEVKKIEDQITEKLPSMIQKIRSLVIIKNI